jgi:hypothetical protein
MNRAGSILFQTTDWKRIPQTICNGETGTACYRTLQLNGLRVRLVEYSENYKADHWCTLGHVVYCIEGEFTSELSDGRIFSLTKGMSYIVSDKVSEHRSTSSEGATLLIVDGNFLEQKKQTPNPWKM